MSHKEEVLKEKLDAMQSAYDEKHELYESASPQEQAVLATEKATWIVWKPPCATSTSAMTKSAMTPNARKKNALTSDT